MTKLTRFPVWSSKCYYFIMFAKKHHTTNFNLTFYSPRTFNTLFHRFDVWRFPIGDQVESSSGRIGSLFSHGRHLQMFSGATKSWIEIVCTLAIQAEKCWLVRLDRFRVHSPGLMLEKRQCSSLVKSKKQRFRDCLVYLLR